MKVRYLLLLSVWVINLISYIKKDHILSVQSVANDPQSDVNVVKYRKTDGWAWQVSRQQLREIPAGDPALFLPGTRVNIEKRKKKKEYGWKESKTTHLFSNSSRHIHLLWDIKTQIRNIQKTDSNTPRIEQLNRNRFHVPVQQQPPKTKRWPFTTNKVILIAKYKVTY